MPDLKCDRNRRLKGRQVHIKAFSDILLFGRFLPAGKDIGQFPFLKIVDQKPENTEVIKPSHGDNKVGNNIVGTYDIQKCQYADHNFAKIESPRNKLR